MFPPEISQSCPSYRFQADYDSRFKQEATPVGPYICYNKILLGVSQIDLRCCYDGEGALQEDAENLDSYDKGGFMHKYPKVSLYIIPASTRCLKYKIFHSYLNTFII